MRLSESCRLAEDPHADLGGLGGDRVGAGQLALDGGAAVEIGRGAAGQEAWSPDGSAIALTQFGAAAADDNLAVVTPAGEEVGFGALAFAVNVLGWAPDASVALAVETTFPEGDP